MSNQTNSRDITVGISGNKVSLETLTLKGPDHESDYMSLVENGQKFLKRGGTHFNSCVFHVSDLNKINGPDCKEIVFGHVSCKDINGEEKSTAFAYGSKGEDGFTWEEGRLYISADIDACPEVSQMNDFNQNLLIWKEDQDVEKKGWNPIPNNNLLSWLQQFNCEEAIKNKDLEEERIKGIYFKVSDLESAKFIGPNAIFERIVLLPVVYLSESLNGTDPLYLDVVTYILIPCIESNTSFPSSHNLVSTWSWPRRWDEPIV